MNATKLTSENSKQESSEEKLPTLWNTLSSDDLSKLYPYLEDVCFSGKDYNQIFTKEPTNPIDKMIKKYLDAEVTPYIKRKNLNEDDPTASDKSAWEIGIKFEF